MSFYVARLNRPYNVHVLIEAYLYTKREDFVHPDFASYYGNLLATLEGMFGIRFSQEGLSFGQRLLWDLFDNTVSSCLQITDPWASYLEASLLVQRLEASGRPGEAVERASAMIREANRVSEMAHRDMLVALFSAIFGEHPRAVTSEELLQAGFDDSKEPDIANYSEFW